MSTDHTPYISDTVAALRGAGHPISDTWWTQEDDDIREAAIPLTGDDDADTLTWDELNGWRLITSDGGDLYDLNLPRVAAPKDVAARLREATAHSHRPMVGGGSTRWEDDEIEEIGAQVDAALAPYSS
jgi:hypothetical protein